MSNIYEKKKECKEEGGGWVGKVVRNQMEKKRIIIIFYKLMSCIKMFVLFSNIDFFSASKLDFYSLLLVLYN